MDHMNFLIGGLCGDQARGQAETLAKPERRWFFGDERIRTALDEKIVDALGGNAAAETRRGIDERHREIKRAIFVEFYKTMGCCQSSNAAADDDNAVVHPSYCSGESRTEIAIDTLDDFPC